MGISHACLGCGLDMAPVRAVTEPHYGLRIVICPRCSRGAVRSGLGGRAGVHRVVRIASAARWIAFQIVMIASLTSLTMLTCVAMPETLSLAELSSMGYQPLIAMLVFGIVLALCTGAWLRAAFRHVSTTAMWCIWLLWLLLVIAVTCLIMWGTGANVYYAGLIHLRGWDSAFDRAMQSIGVGAIWSVEVLVMMFIAALGVPLGSAGRVIADRVRRARWRARRRTRRAMRVTIARPIRNMIHPSTGVGTPGAGTSGKRNGQNPSRNPGAGAGVETT